MNISRHPPTRLPSSRIPPWERRRRPDRWKWNGNRKGDPRLPALDPALEASPMRVILYGLAGSLLGLGFLLLAMK